MSGGVTRDLVPHLSGVLHLHVNVLRPASRRFAAVTKPHRIGWENNAQTKLTRELRPKTKELRHIGVQSNMITPTETGCVGIALFYYLLL